MEFPDRGKAVFGERNLEDGEGKRGRDLSYYYSEKKEGGGQPTLEYQGQEGPYAKKEEKQSAFVLSSEWRGKEKGKKICDLREKKKCD